MIRFAQQTEASTKLISASTPIVFPSTDIEVAPAFVETFAGGLLMPNLPDVSAPSLVKTAKTRATKKIKGSAEPDVAQLGLDA